MIQSELKFVNGTGLPGLESGGREAQPRGLAIKSLSPDLQPAKILRRGQVDSTNPEHRLVNL